MNKFLFLLFALIAFSSCDKKNKAVLESIQPRNDNTPHRVTKLVADEIIDKKATTFFLVRHAEKMKDSNNPALTEKGIKRALDLEKVLSNIPIKAIYTSDFLRTKQTVEYMAMMRNMDGDVKIYNHKDLKGAAKEMITNHSKKVILVSGHSNSTPAMINILTGTADWESLSESDYDNLFIVSVYENAPANVLHFKYGEPNS